MTRDSLQTPTRGLVALMVVLAFSPAGVGIAAGADEARAEKLKQEYSDAAAVRSRLVVLRVGQGREARPVVVLKKPVTAKEIPEHYGPTRHNLLARELVRQSVLIAARDELGAITRDEVIGDNPVEVGVGKPGGEERVEVVSFIRDLQSRERIYRVVKDRVEPLYSHDTPVTAPWPEINWMKLLEATEIDSRQELPKVLRGLGLEGKANAVKEGPVPRLPGQVEGQLLGLGFSQTLAALRELHLAMRSTGETPTAVGALVRGYAQLGVLSEFHWHPAHKAFKARALLYAQRMVARDPKQPWGLWHRAFALAMVGLHRAAMADLDSAKKLAVPGAEAPAWLELVDAASRYDVRRLAAQRGPYQKLAALLRMIALEFPTTTAISLQSAKEVVPLDPLCFRALDAMCQYKGVNNLHTATQIGPQVLEQLFASDLLAIKTLPAIVKERLGNEIGVIELADVLVKAGAPGVDDGEPSWGVLAHLLRETRFVQVWRRLDFMRDWWGVPVDEYWNQVRADVVDHRYFPYLETLSLPRGESWPRFLKMIDEIDLTEIEKSSFAMNRFFWSTQRPRGKAAWEMSWAHADLNARERSFAQSTEDAKEHPHAAREILQVSPYNQYARATLIDFEWDKVKDDVKTWEKEAGDAPAVLGTLGWQLSVRKQYDDAQRVFERYIALSPDLWVYRKLAENYKEQGKIDRWQETLDEFLNKVEDLGLDHSNVRIEIAEFYMGRKEWEKAQPYAEDAAQSMSNRSMECAGRCAEGMKDWERAEAWHRVISERYDRDSWSDWYYFCKRTGHGNLKAARDFVDQVIADRANRRDPVGEEAAGIFYWLDGRTDKAKAVLGKAYADRRSFIGASCLAVIADEAKEGGRRDQLLNDVIAQYKQKYPGVTDIYQTLLDTVLVPGGKKPLDAPALVRLIEASGPDRDFMSFYAGCLLKNHGQADTAKPLLEHSANSPKFAMGFRLLAEDAIKRMTTKP